MKYKRKNRYGIDPVRTQREVARLLGVSHGTIRNIENSAMAKLRKAFEEPVRVPVRA